MPRVPLPLWLLTWTALSIAPSRLAQDASTSGAPSALDATFSFPELGLKFIPPRLDALAIGKSQAETCKGVWTARLGSSDVRLIFHVFRGPAYDNPEPEDAVEGWRSSMTNPESADPTNLLFDYSFGPIRTRSGPFGASPILAVIDAELRLKSDPSKKTWLSIAGGRIADGSWSMRIEVVPRPPAEDIAVWTRWLETCASYEGKLRDPKWTDEDATAFFKSRVPEALQKKVQKPIRTEHFIVLTDSTSSGPYVKKLETKYATVRKALPFEEVPGRQLLPILLFRTDAEFQAHYRRIYKMGPKEEVKEGGVVADHCLATSCENRDDYEDLVDLTKLLMICRLRIWGGPRWFEDGLREYVASKPKTRAETLLVVQVGQFTPIDKLLDDEAWSKRPSDLSIGDPRYEPSYWEQSAMWMEFLRDGAWPAELFPRLLTTIGGLRRGDRAGTKAALESIYGMHLPDLEERWFAFFQRRH